MRAIICALLLLLNAGEANATTWYVNSAGGNDSSNGKSPGTSFLTLQHAAGVTAAGDTVNIRGVFGGGTGGTAPLVISTSGTGAGTTANTPCTSQITYQTDPLSSVRAQINGTQASGAISGTNPLSCITINNLEIAGWNGVLTWAGVSANAGVGATATTTGAYNGYGIFFAGTTGGTGTTSVHHIMVTNSVIHDFPCNGIGINFGDYLTATGDTIYNDGNYSPLGCSGISFYDPHNIDAGTGTKNYISGNTIYNVTNQVPEHAAIQATTTVSGTNALGTTTLNLTSNSGANYTEGVIDVTTGCVPPGTYVTNPASGTNQITISQATTCSLSSGQTIQLGYLTDGEGIIVDNTTNTQSDSVAYIGRTLATNNMIFGNGSSGLECSPGSAHCDFTFNTLYFNQTRPDIIFNPTGAAGELNNLNSADSNFYNNIIIASSVTPVAWDQQASTTVWSHNAISGGISGNGGHSIPGSGNVTAAPLIVNPSTNPLTANFQLQPGSPAIGAGSTTYSRTADIAGNPGIWQALPDIGAFAQPCIMYGTPAYQTLAINQAGSVCRSR